MSTPYRPCPQCGMPQTPAQTFCNNCGTSLVTGPGNFGYANSPASPQSWAGENVDQLPFPSETPFGQPPASFGTNMQYGNTAYGNGGQTYPPPQPASTAYSPPNAYNTAPEAGPYNQPTYNQPAYNQPTQANYSPYTQGPQEAPFPPPQPKRKPGVLFLVLGVLLLFVLAGGGFFAYKASKGMNHTSTPSASASSQSPTKIPTQPALFTDNFANNSKNWDSRLASGYGVTISNSVLTMREANHRIFQEPVPTTMPNDFTVTTTFTLTQGDSNDSVGLQLRTTTDNSQGYVVEIYGDNTYDIVKISPDPNDSNKLKFTALVPPTASPAIKPKGTPNTMTITMKGANLVVQFNGTVVKSLADTSFTGGSLNLFLVNGDTSTGATAIFSNLTIYPAPAQLPN